MNTINERIRYLRKDVFKLTQADFAAKIGMKQRSISTLESKNGRVTDRVIRDIGHAFNVHEKWLRTGEGSAFTEDPKADTPPKDSNDDSSKFSLNDFLHEHNATEFELSIMRAYFELEPVTRSLLLNHFKSRISAPVDDEIVVLEDEYKKMLSEMQSKRNATASNTIGDTKGKRKQA